MSLKPELLEILVCPATHQRLSLMAEAEVTELNERIRGGTVHNARGEPVRDEVEGALVREDREVAYLVRGGIPVMLADEAISLSPR